MVVTHAYILEPTRLSEMVLPSGKYILSIEMNNNMKIENDVLFSNDAGILGKEIPSSPNRSRTYDLPITSSDALPLSYRRLVRAKAIKLVSWDKHPAYC